MKRFLPHEELARDVRFKRTNSRNELFRSLPHDADGIVRVLEEIAPKIRERVEGTALEPVFDDLGPGFMILTTAAGAAQTVDRTPLQLRAQLHGIFVGELQALEAASRTVWDFPDAPWEFKMNMARQCWDEARHVQIFEKLIDHVGGEVGEFPENTFLYETSCAEDPVLRVAGVNRCLEGLACDAFRALIEYGKAKDDDVVAQASDFVLADELTHVRFGSDWVKRFTEDDPERATRAKEFQRETDARFAFGTRSVAREERLEAGFTEEELDELDEILDQGPPRKILLEAAQTLMERHRARSRGEDVPAAVGLAGRAPMPEIDWGEAERRLTDRVSVLVGNRSGGYPSGNSVLVRGSSETIVIDPSVDVVARGGVPALRVDAVLNSHAHEDHMPGNGLFADARVHIHDADLPGAQSTEGLMAVYGIRDADAARAFERMIVEEFHFTPRPDAEGFSDGHVFDLGGLAVEAVHLPGHTRGHSGFRISDDVFFLSDIDLTGFGPYYGDAWSDLEDFEESLRRVRDEDARFYVTFHQKGIIEGRETFVEMLDRFHAVIDRRHTEMLAFLSEPRTLDDMADRRFVYRPHVEAPFVGSVERRSAELHVARMLTRGEARDCGDGRFQAA